MWSSDYWKRCSILQIWSLFLWICGPLFCDSDPLMDQRIKFTKISNQFHIKSWIWITKSKTVFCNRRTTFDLANIFHDFFMVTICNLWSFVRTYFSGEKVDVYIAKCVCVVHVCSLIISLPFRSISTITNQLKFWQTREKNPSIFAMQTNNNWKVWTHIE